MREFEQMEMQFFIKPGSQKEWYEYWKKNDGWHQSLGIKKENLQFHDLIKLAHYADAACDIEFKFPFGFKELEVFTQELILILSNMKNIQKRNNAILTEKMKVTFHT